MKQTRFVLLGMAVTALLCAGGCAITTEDVREMGSEGDVSGLEDLLFTSEERPLKTAAAVELGRLDDPAAGEVLTRALSSSSGDVRKAALTGLSHSGKTPDLARLFEIATKDTDPSMRKKAEELLAVKAEDAKKILLNKLGSRDYRERALAARWLGNAKDPEVVRALINTGRFEENAEVRRWVAISLGRINDPEAKGLLHRMRWQDPDPSVAMEAEKALARFTPPVFDLRLAVVPLDNSISTKKQKELGKEFSQVISAALEKEKICHMIERARIDKALEELKLGVSDLADEETACELGRFLTAQQVVYGSVQRDGQEYTVVVQRMDVETLKILQSVTEKAYEADLGQLKTRIADQFVRTFQGAY